MYFPMIGFATAMALLLERFPRAVPASVLVVLAALSVFRTTTWRTEASLWADAVEKAPFKVRPRVQLARASEPARALEILETARNMAPQDPAIASEEGRIYLSLGRPEQSLREYGRALALAPKSADAFNNRGAALLALD